MPKYELVKLNTDGASKGNPRRASCGGIVRAENGKWIEGFMANIGMSTSYVAELWGIVYGLEMAWECGQRRVIVESDNMEIISAINKNPLRDRCGNFFARIREWKNKDWDLNFRHVYRESNECADWLANRGLAHDIGVRWLENLG